jgi:hypothetical protein
MGDGTINLKVNQSRFRLSIKQNHCITDSASLLRSSVLQSGYNIVSVLCFRDVEDLLETGIADIQFSGINGCFVPEADLGELLLIGG